MRTPSKYVPFSDDRSFTSNAVLTDGAEVQVGKFRLTFYASRVDLAHLAKR